MRALCGQGHELVLRSQHEDAFLLHTRAKSLIVTHEGIIKKNDSCTQLTAFVDDLGQSISLDAFSVQTAQALGRERSSTIDSGVLNAPSSPCESIESVSLVNLSVFAPAKTNKRKSLGELFSFESTCAVS